MLDNSLADRPFQLLLFQSKRSSKMDRCPWPGCIDCIMHLKEPARTTEMKKRMTMLPKGNSENAKKERAFDIYNLKTSLERFEMQKKNKEIMVEGSPLAKRFLKAGAIPCLIDIIKLNEPLMRSYCLDIMMCLADEATIDEYHCEGKLVPLLIDIIHNGFIYEKHCACRVLQVAFFKRGFEKYDHLYDFEKMVLGLVNIDQITVQQVIDEVSIETWQLDMIRTNTKMQKMKRFIPNYLLHVHEVALMALFNITWDYYPDPKKRMQIIKIPGLVPLVLKYFAIPTPEAYPNWKHPNFVVDAFLMMMSYRPSEKPPKELFEYLGSVVKPEQIISIIDKLANQTIESLVPDLTNQKKYMLDEEFHESQLIHDHVLQGSQRNVILTLVNGLVEFADKATSLVTVAGTLEHFIKKMLNPGSPTDVLFEKAVPWEVRPKPQFPGPRFYRMGLMSLCLLILLNFQLRVPSFKSSLPNLMQLATTEASKMKEEGNKLFQKKEYEAAFHLYTNSILLGDKVNPKHPDLYIFYSNRCECLLQLELPQKALDDAQQALTLKPDHDKSLARKERAVEALIKTVD